MKKLTFNSIKLSNFGPFKGLQSLDLDTTTKAPIVLIEGMNGSGKTSLLIAFQIVLFGARIYSKSKQENYERLIKELKRADSECFPLLSAEITFENFSKKRTYQITRTWKWKKNFQELVEIHETQNKEPLTIDEWDQLVESFFPICVSRLFFFDGEKIDDIAMSSTLPSLIRESTEILFGIYELNSLINDTLAFERRSLLQNKNQVSESLPLRNAYYLKKSEIELLEKHIESTYSELASKQNSIDLSIKKYDDLTKEAEKKGINLYNKRTELEKKYAAVSADYAMAKREAIQAISNPYLPLFAASELLNALFTQYDLDVLAKDYALVSRVLKLHNKYIVTRLKKLIPDRKEIISHVVEEANKRISIPETTSYFSAMDSKNNIEKNIAEAISTQKMASEFLEIQKRKFDSIRTLLETIPDEELIIPVLNQQKELKTTINKEKTDAEIMREKLSYLTDQLSKKEHDLIRIEEKLNLTSRMDAHSKLAIEASKRVRDVLKVFKQELLTKKLEQFSERLTSYFCTLLHKKSFVKRVQISEKDFAISVVFSDGSILPINRLSAGERQILATSILGILINLSNNNLPLIIDTPLARLDRAHRLSILNEFYSKISHQVVILSTDEELTGNLKEAAQAFISKNYQLIYDDSSKSTKIWG